MSMEWREPPSRGGTEHDWDKVAEALHRHRTRWLLLGKAERISLANAIRQSSIRALGQVEVRTRRSHTDEQGVRRADIYIRKGTK